MRFKTFLLTVCILLTGIFSVVGQEKFNDKNNKKNDKKKPQKIDLKKGLKRGDQVSEVTILVYGGRTRLNQIRKTTLEIGKLKINNPDGTTTNASYEQKILRADSLDKERIRIDQKLPNAEFALVYDGKKTFGVFNNSVFTPREDATQAFQNRIWHGMEALLRYKENGSTVKLEKVEKIMGVELYVVSVTDKSKRKTLFYVSKKSFRIMMLEYENGGVKYRRKFYNQLAAQGTLVPYRSVLWADGKIVEEKNISTITFGKKLDEVDFSSNL